MTILKPGDPKRHAIPRNPWQGLKFRCPGCGCIARVDLKDTPKQGTSRQFRECPQIGCDELIYFAGTNHDARLESCRHEDITIRT